MKHIKLFENFNKEKQAIIDDILDKVSKSGIESLTEIEREYLDNVDNEEHVSEYSNRNEKITFIKDMVNKNGGSLTMGEMEADFSPKVNIDGDEYHLIEVLDDETCEVVVYGGYKNETVLREYTMEYSELSDETIDHIFDIIKYAQLFED